MTKIEWVKNPDGSQGVTWSPVTGCTKISPGCANCYAERLARRYRGRFGYPQDDPFRVTIHEGKLEEPLHWRKSRMVFVCSMADLFHADMSFDTIDKVFAVMALCRRHTFQVLTKRPERMAEYLRTIEEKPQDRSKYDCQDHSLAPRIGKLAGDIESNLHNKLPMFSRPGCVLYDRCHFPFENVWLGTSCENQEALDERTGHLYKCPAAVRFLSLEPLLGDVDLTRIPYGTIEQLPDVAARSVFVNALDNSIEQRINWVIVGGESGPGARPMDPDWVRSIRDQCVAAGMPFFFKGWGGMNKKKAGRVLDGRTWDEMPKMQDM